MNTKRIMLSIAMVGALFCNSHVMVGMSIKFDLIDLAVPLGIVVGGAAGTTAGLIFGAQKGALWAVRQSLNSTKGTVVGGLTGGLVGLPVGMVTGGIVGYAIFVLDVMIYEAKRRYSLWTEKRIEQEQANQDKQKDLSQ